MLSQCDNLVLMRMNSAADLGHVGGVFSFVPPGLIDRATTFAQGEALVAGKIASHPALIRFGARISRGGRRRRGGLGVNAHRGLRADRRPASRAALVGRDGSVDWLCLPRFDSASCFSALLGDERHGRWLVAPAGEVRATSRRYRPGTLVLETDFETADGAVRVIDFMPRRGAGPPRVMRIVEGLRGPRPDADGAVAAPGLRVDHAVGRAGAGRGGRHRRARTRSGSARRCRCRSRTAR